MAAIAEATILVPCHVVLNEALLPIWWRSKETLWNFRVLMEVNDPAPRDCHDFRTLAVPTDTGAWSSDGLQRPDDKYRAPGQ